MDNLIIILIIALIIFIGILIALLAYFGHRFLKLRELEAKNGDRPKTTEASPLKTTMKPEVLEALRAKKEEKKTSLYCVDHPEEFAKGRCAISGESYCEHCLTKQGDVRISKKYLDLYLDNEWVEVSMIPNDDENIDLKERILKMKKT
jgi:hypothetical protein